MRHIDPAEARKKIGADHEPYNGLDRGLEMLAWMLLAFCGATVLIVIVTIATIFF